MPLDTEILNFGDEIDRIDEEIADKRDEIQSILNDLDDDEDPPNRVDVLSSQIGSLKRHRSGLQWAQTQYDADSVTLAALTAGEMALVEDESPRDVGDGQVRIYFTAAGTVDAPWLEHDPDAPDPEAYRDTVANVSQLAPGLARWAETQINNLGSFGPDEGNS